MKTHRRVMKMFTQFPWAILPATLDTMIEIMELRASGLAFTDEEIRARIGAPQRPAPSTQGTVAVLPLHGVIAPRMNVMTQISGGTSADVFGAMLTTLVNDPGISAVVIDADTPGGSVFGVEELAATMRSLRGRKPIVTAVNHLLASAGYWLAAQTDEIIVSPSSQTGSIGVVAVHQEVSGAQAKLGVKTTLVTAGKHKADGNSFEPLSDDARSGMQALVDRYYTAFTSDVAKGRGVKVGAVRDGFGQGRVVSSEEAVALGMADGIGTLAQVVDRLASGAKRVTDAAAAAAIEPPAIDDTARLAVEERMQLREALAART